jgi:fused signal recognition particle receptor
MFNKFTTGLKKTRQAISNSISSFSEILGGNSIDNDTLEELEEALILADVGATAASDILDKLKSETNGDNPEKTLARIIAEKFSALTTETITDKPKVILIVGVNGSGKTTTIAKLAHREIASGKKVILAAADTFRAAAGEQLEHWADRVGADIIKQASGSDPAAVAFDAVKAGVSRSADMVIIDTAGRLQTKTNLMEGWKKINRVVKKATPGAPHEVLMVMDATTGQNGLSQVDLFNQAVGLTGIVVTKLDGTAKGGVLVAASERFKIPIKFVGLGEKQDDLINFDPLMFAEGLVGVGADD